MTGHAIFSQPWADAFKAALNQNEAYAEAGRTWEGPLVFLVRADPGHGIDEDRSVLLDLWHGECRQAEALPSDKATAQADYVILGDRRTWFDVLDGELEPLKALMFGKLKLSKGKLRDLLPYIKASKEMVESAREVPTAR